MYPTNLTDGDALFINQALAADLGFTRANTLAVAMAILVFINKPTAQLDAPALSFDTIAKEQAESDLYFINELIAVDTNSVLSVITSLWVSEHDRIHRAESLVTDGDPSGNPYLNQMRNTLGKKMYETFLSDSQVQGLFNGYVSVIKNAHSVFANLK